MQKIVAEVLEKLNAQVMGVQKVISGSATAQFLRLNRPVELTLVLWPTIWGFLGTQQTNWWHLASLVMLAGLMAIFALVYLEEATEDKNAPNRQLALLAVGGFGLWFSFTMGVAPFLLLLVWGLGVAAYPTVMRLTWWPQLYAAGLFGFLPVLLGQSGSGGISLSTIPLALAAFLWALGVEALRADAEKLQTLQKGLKSVALWLGDKNISLVTASMAGSLVIFVISGLAQSMNGLFYAGLMAAQTTLFLCYLQKDKEDPFPPIALAGLFIALGLLVS